MADTLSLVEKGVLICNLFYPLDPLDWLDILMEIETLAVTDSWVANPEPILSFQPFHFKFSIEGIKPLALAIEYL